MEKLYKCKYQATFDILKQEDIRYYLGDKNVQKIQVQLQDIHLDEKVICKTIIKYLQTNEQHTQENNITLDIQNNVITILINDEYINQAGEYMLRLYLEWLDDNKVVKRLVIKAIKFNILDERSVM